jgi:diguanylate cyclase (GGDEF)-like protein
MALHSALCMDESDLRSRLSRKTGNDCFSGFPHRLVRLHQLTSSLATVRDLEDLHVRLASAYADWMPDARVRLLPTENGDVAPEGTPGFRFADGEIPPPAHPIPADCPEDHSASTFRSPPSSETSRSVMTLPLRGPGGLLGYMEITDPQPERFSTLDYHVSLLVASHVSCVLENVLNRRKLVRTLDLLMYQEVLLKKLHGKLKDLALTDDLTGLSNRRSLLTQLDREIARVRRYGGELSCLMIDIDGFKLVNDFHGHPAGDALLRQLGGVFLRCSRSTDIVARYGGDEFTVVLPQTGARGAGCAAEKLRRNVQKHPFSVGTASPIPITISVGSVTCAAPLPPASEDIISRADRALYQAKHAGGDQVIQAH